MDIAEILLSIFSGLCLLLGAFAILTGSLGVLRFPDFFSRLHPAGMIDTAGAALLIIGMMILAGLSLISVKLLLILVFLMITGPVASHATARAALAAGRVPKARLLRAAAPDNAIKEATAKGEDALNKEPGLS